MSLLSFAQHYLDTALSGNPNRNAVVDNINEHFNGRFDRAVGGLLEYSNILSGNTNSALRSQLPNNNFDFTNKLQRTKLALELFRLKYDELSK